jgi:hypothetical protein
MRQRAAVQLALSIDYRLGPELAGLDGTFFDPLTFVRERLRMADAEQAGYSFAPYVTC